MKLRKIENKYKRSVHTLSGGYDHLFNKFDPDDNHEFRVEIKKLRAFIRLVNVSQPENQSKISKPIKKFYRLVGDIRNLQLHEQRIQSLSSDLVIENPELYLEGLYQEEKSLKKEANHKAALSFKSFQKKLVGEAPAELTEGSKNEFVRRSLSRLSQLLSLPEYSDENFHDLRKIIKDLIYNFDYLEGAIVSILPAPLNGLKFMEDLADMLGDFHDLSLALLFLGKVEESENATMLAELKSHLQLRKDNLKSEILHLLDPVKQAIE